MLLLSITNHATNSIYRLLADEQVFHYFTSDTLNGIYCSLQRVTGIRLFRACLFDVRKAGYCINVTNAIDNIANMKKN